MDWIDIVTGVCFAYIVFYVALPLIQRIDWTYIKLIIKWFK